MAAILIFRSNRRLKHSLHLIVYILCCEAEFLIKHLVRSRESEAFKTVDLAVASHKKEGNHVCDSFVYWGGPDGINTERFTPIPGRGPHGMSTVDVGNIMDRSDSEYYVSEAFKSDTKATKISWVAENGPSTWVKMQLRCAATPEALECAEWSETFENGADVSALNLKGYIQYKLDLGARCGAGTPRVTEVTVDFE